MEGKSLEMPRFLKCAVVILALILPAALSAGEEKGIVLRYVFSIGGFGKERFESPTGLFIDRSKGELYVADNGAHEVLIFDLKGYPLYRLGKKQGIRNPFDVAAHNDRIYLSEEGSPDIKILSYRGEPAGRVSSSGAEKFYPGQIYIGAGGNIYAVDKSKPSAVVFDAKGGLVMEISGKFGSLADVSADDARVYLVTPYSKRVIQVYDSNGARVMGFEALEGQGGTLALPVAAKPDADGNIWVVDALHGIAIYDKDGREIGRFGEYGEDKGQLFFPIDIDFDGLNMVYILEKGAKRVSVFRVER